MKRKKILSVILTSTLMTSSLLLVNNVAQAYTIKNTNVSSNTNLKSNTVIKKGTTIPPALNVRSNASLNSKILTSLKNNTSVEIVDTVGNWYKIKLGTNYGYVSKQYIRVDTLKDSKNNTSTNINTSNSNFKKGIVLASHLNVRNSASLNSKILTSLKNNTSVEIVDTIGNWYKIKLGTNYGYVFKQYIKIQ